MAPGKNGLDPWRLTVPVGISKPSHQPAAPELRQCQSADGAEMAAIT